MDEYPESLPTQPEPTQREPTQREQIRELRTPLTVRLGRVKLLRHRRARSQEPLARDDELEAMEVAVLRLVAAVGRLEGRP
jgi:signal transduction histidine kinase